MYIDMGVTTGHPQMCDDVEDQFAVLPDDMLVSILSNLKLEEAARTSVLSRRWKNLWMHTYSLEFDKFELVHHLMHSNADQKSAQVARSRFIAWVNSVLGLHKSSILNKFKICFSLDDTSSNVINDWIIFALQRRVTSLVLDFERNDPFPSKRYSLTTEFLCNHQFGSLTILHLNCIDVTGRAIEYILSSCQLLQVLHVQRSSCLVDLRIPSHLPTLKNVEISDCWSMKYLGVNATNIVSFTYRGPRIQLFFKEIPCLVEAAFGGDYAVFLVRNIHQFASYILQLHSLVLDIRSWMAWLDVKYGDFPKFPVFQNLRLLELHLSGLTVNGYVRRCTLLLKASPVLHKFKLRIGLIIGRTNLKIRGEWDMKKLARSACQHHQVKVLELVNFEGTASSLEIALRLLNKCPSLDKAIVRPPTSEFLSPQELQEAISNARRLQSWISTKVELVIAP